MTMTTPAAPSGSTSNNLQTLQKAELKLGGMTCTACSGAITNMFKAEEGIQSVSVHLLLNIGTVVYDSNVIKKAEDLCEMVEDIGFEAELVGVEPVNSGNTNAMERAAAGEDSTKDDKLGKSGNKQPISPAISTTEVAEIHLWNYPRKVPMDEVFPDMQAVRNVTEVKLKTKHLGRAFTSVVDGADADNENAALTVLPISPMGSGDPGDMSPNSALRAKAGIILPETRRGTAQDYRSLSCVRYFPHRIGARKVLELARENGSPEIFHDADMADTVTRLATSVFGSQQQELDSLKRNFFFSLPFTLAMLTLVFFVPGDSELSTGTLKQLVVPGLHVQTLLFFLLATPVMFVFGARFHKGARKAWRNRTPNMDVLVSLAAGISWTYSVVVAVIAIVAATSFGIVCKQPMPHFFEAPTTLITVLLGGKWLEIRSKKKTISTLERLVARNNAVRSVSLVLKGLGEGEKEKDSILKAVRDLVWEREERVRLNSPNNRGDYSPPSGIGGGASSSSTSGSVQQGERSIRFPRELLEIGDEILLGPGDMVPVDGLILSNDSVLVDEAMLTGEARGIQKTVDQQLFAGSFVLRGACKIKVQRLGSETLLNQMSGMIREAQASRADVQHLADRIAIKFVPCVMLFAAFVSVVWTFMVFTFDDPHGDLGAPMAMDDDLGRNSFVDASVKLLFALKFGLAVLLVACPCAMGLATPTAVVVATGRAAEFGILLKGTQPLELAARKNIRIVMDKTGTLTEGRPKVVAFSVYDVGSVALSGEGSGSFLSADEISNTSPPVDGSIAEMSMIDTGEEVVRGETIFGGAVAKEKLSMFEGRHQKMDDDAWGTNDNAAQESDSSGSGRGNRGNSGRGNGGQMNRRNNNNNGSNSKLYTTSPTLLEKISPNISPDIEPVSPSLSRDAFGTTFVVGKPVLDERATSDPRRIYEFWFILAHIEARSEHPLALALLEHSKEQFHIIPESDRVRNFENISGRGVKAEVYSKQLRKWLSVLVGNEALVGLTPDAVDGESTMREGGNADSSGQQNGEDKIPSPAALQQDRGSTVVFVAVEGTLLGWTAIRDAVRPGVDAALTELRNQGHEIYMCTGDAERTALTVAREVGIPKKNVRSQALPSDKIRFVKQLQSGMVNSSRNSRNERDDSNTGGARSSASFLASSAPPIHKRNPVFFVGDGINDGPALASADVGFAIGCGAQVTVQAADVVLTKSDLSHTLLTFLQLGQKTLHVIWRNLFWAFIFNFCTLPIASGFFYPCCRISVPPLAAGTAMAASSTLVLVSSLTLRNFKPRLRVDME